MTLSCVFLCTFTDICAHLLVVLHIFSFVHIDRFDGIQSKNWTHVSEFLCSVTEPLPGPVVVPPLSELKVWQLTGSDLTVSSSGQVALAVILTVAILALLAVMTYCILKARRKRTHQPVATSPAMVALSEPDTSVYNSTTKPV